MKRNFMKLGICIAWFVLYIIIVMKLPFYFYINGIELPEGCKNMKIRAIYSDAAWYHFAAERLIYTDYNKEEIDTYIHKEGKYPNVNVDYFFFSDMCDRIIWPDEYEDSVSRAENPETEKQKYILLYYTTIGTAYMMNVPTFVGVSAILSTVLFFLILTVLESVCARRRKRVSAAQERDSEWKIDKENGV